ncbi:DUF4304 domain-containing protein [Flavobacterium anhuiense]|uniref:DUF4304 domain-containing protein n=1 Tax=Flavobacterium anhuiense TaxID=459526 RepID=UPI003D9792D9
MDAKEKQLEFIKIYLKPTLKDFGYKTSGQTWWKDKGEFYTLINLQNFSWNTKNEVNFCFNIGIVLKSEIKDVTKKPKIYDVIVHLRENSYLSDKNDKHSFRNKTGYLLENHTDMTDFYKELKSDFENFVLPKLEKLNSLQDCIDNFGKIPFFGERLINAIKIKK